MIDSDPVGLSALVMRAGAWSLGVRLTGRALLIVETVVLARLLAPEEFGQVGVAFLAIGLLEAGSRTGFDAALVQRRGELGPYLNTAWTAEVARGALLGILLAAAAPAAGAFFQSAEAVPLVRAMGLVVAIRGLTNVGIVTFDRELAFARRSALQLAERISFAAASICLAFLLRSPWAIVLGALTAAGVRVVASYLLHPYRPRLHLELGPLNDLFEFGRWILGSSLLVYALLHLDDVVVGRVAGIAALGLYQMGYTISQLAATDLTLVANEVAFPAYARLQDQLDRARSGYLRMNGVVALVAFPMTAGLVVLAPEMVAVLLGPAWSPMVPALRPLALWGLIRSVSAGTGPLFQGLGKPEVATKLQLAKLVLMAAGVYPATTAWGIEGAAWSVLGTALVVDLLAIDRARRMVTASVAELLRPLRAPAVAAAVMTVALVAVKGLTGIGLLPLVTAAALGTAAYGAALALQRSR
jgi:lipopolysaccharide exporter